MNKLTNKSTLIVAALLGILGQANAASISFTMEFSSNPGLLPDGNNYLSVMISDGQDGDIDFSVKTQSGIQNVGGALPPGITSFSFNFGSSGATIDNVVSYDKWQPIGKESPQIEPVKRLSNPKTGDSLFTKVAEPKASVFGDFDVTLLMTAGGSVDPLLFSIVGVEGDSIYDYASSLSTGVAERFNTLFSANVENLKICQLEISSVTGGNNGGPCIDKSTFGGPTTVVPLPPAMALMFSAMALLGGISLRRRKQV